MSAVDKTDALERKDVDIGLLDMNEHNPNVMGDREFNMLCDNLERTGITDPILVRALEDGRYRIVGGHHRYQAAKLLDFEKVPCTIITDPNFDDDLEKYQVVRMNMIRGKLDGKKFLKLYESLSEHYEEEVMAEAFGFTDEEAFKKLINQMASTLPKTQQGEFKKAAEEIKTIDGLSTLLNKMFSEHGDTLPHGYMVVDFGGKESVWVRMTASDHKHFLATAAVCKEQNRPVDSLFRLFLQSVASGGLTDLVEALEDFPEVQA